MLAYRGLHSYRGDGPPGAWLARIAIRECWRLSRSQRRRVSLTQPLDEVIQSTTVDPADVAREVLVAEENAEVRRALEALPEPYREVVSLRFLGERSLADIALVTGRPEATVKTENDSAPFFIMARVVSASTSTLAADASNTFWSISQSATSSTLGWPVISLMWSLPRPRRPMVATRMVSLGLPKTVEEAAAAAAVVMKKFRRSIDSFSAIRRLLYHIHGISADPA